MADDFRISSTTVHVEGCLWATSRARRWFDSGNRSRNQIRDAVRRQGYTLCPDCRPLDTLPKLDQTGASRG
jgi:hypothetical protein